MRGKCKQLLCMVLAAAMVVTMAPTSYAKGKDSTEKLAQKYRKAVSDKKYPNGKIDILKTRLTTVEGKSKTIKIVRSGNTDKEATVKFKAIDVTAKYGEDYTVTVKKGFFASETLDKKDDSKSMVQQAADENAMDEVSGTAVEEATEAPATATPTAQAKEEKIKKAKKGLDAAYGSLSKKTSKNEKAPSYDWKEYNDKNVPKEIKKEMEEEYRLTKEQFAEADGVETILTFAPGEFMKEIEIDTIDDDKSESDEQLMFAIYEAKCAALGSRYNGYLNIRDDEAVEDNVYAMKDKVISVNAGEKSVELTVKRTKGVNQLGFATVVSKAITAKAGEDYEPMSKTLVFAPGQKEQTVKVDVKDAPEKDSTFYVGVVADKEAKTNAVDCATIVTLRSKKTVLKTASKGGKEVYMEDTSDDPPSVKTESISKDAKNDYRLADKVSAKVNYSGTRNWTTGKGCSKKNHSSSTKRIRLCIRAANGSTVCGNWEYVDGNGSKTISVSRDLYKDLEAWGACGNATVYVEGQPTGENDQCSASIDGNVTVQYPKITVRIENEMSYLNYFFNKKITGSNSAKEDDEDHRIKIADGCIGDDHKKTSVAIYKSGPFNGSTYFVSNSNSAGVKADSKTVDFMGWCLRKKNTEYSTDAFGKKDYHSIFSKTYKSINVDYDFVKNNKECLYNDLVIKVVPDFQVKPVEITFATKGSATSGPVDERGQFLNFKAGETIKATKLDTISISAAANKGSAITKMALTATDGKSVFDNSSKAGSKADFDTPLNIDGSKAIVTTQFELSSLKVMLDPKFKNITKADDGAVVYVDDNNEASSTKAGDAPITITDITLGKVYNIVGIGASKDNGDGTTTPLYQPSWRDGTLDDDEDGNIDAEEGSGYKMFTPVKGAVLPYLAQLAKGRVYYSFETISPVDEPSDVTGYVKLKDKLILTEEESTKALNGATITCNNVQGNTTINPKNKKGGYFRLSAKTFDARAYYLANISYNADIGSIKSSFVVNPAADKNCIIDASEELDISKPKLKTASKDTKDTDTSKFKAVAMDTENQDDDGYYIGLTNADKKMMITMQAKKTGIMFEKAQLSFYKMVDDQYKEYKTIDGNRVSDDGEFSFIFNPKADGIAEGTIMKVAFTDNQGRTYLKRDLGIKFAQSLGLLGVVNTFSFGAVGKVLDIIGPVCSAFDFSVPDIDLDDLSETNDKVVKSGTDLIISYGFSKDFSKQMFKKGNYLDASKKTADAKQKMEATEKEIKDILAPYKDIKDESKLPKDIQDTLKGYRNNLDVQKTVYDDAKTAQEKLKDGDGKVKKTITEFGGKAKLGLSFKVALSFGLDQTNSKRYFKSLVIEGEVTGGIDTSVNFTTPIGIDVLISFGIGGTGKAVFTIEEMDNKRFCIEDATATDPKLNIFKLNQNSSETALMAKGAFTLQPYVSLSVGVGILGGVLAECTVNGKADFDFNFFTTTTKDYGNVHLDASVKLTILKIFSHSWKFYSGDFNLFGGSPKSVSALEANDTSTILYESADLLKADKMEYMKGGTKWGAKPKSVKSIDENPNGYSEEAIADKVAANPNFKMISYGNGEALAVFLNAVTEEQRNTENNNAVYYTLKDSTGKWSAPVLIEKDMTLDQEPKVYDLGDRGAFITWSTTDKPYDSKSDKIDMLNGMNVHGVFFDKESKTIGEIQKITETTEDTNKDADFDYSDCSSDVATNVSFNDEKLIVYYQKKEYAKTGAEELVGDTVYPETAIMAARVYSFADKKWTNNYSESDKVTLQANGNKRVADYEKCFYGQRFFDFLPAAKLNEEYDEDGYTTSINPVAIDNTVSQIVDTDASSYNDLGVFAYSVDIDGNHKTSNDKDLYMQLYDFKTNKFTTPIIITSDDKSDSNVKFVDVRGEKFLTWLRDGNIVSLDMSTIIKNKDALLKSGTVDGRKYYYINKDKPADVEADDAYKPIQVNVRPEKVSSNEMDMTKEEITEATDEETESPINEFEVKASKDYIYYMWTEASDYKADEKGEDTAENSLVNNHMYTARYDVEEGYCSKPVQVTSAKGANYSGATFVVDGDKLSGLVYRAESKLITYEEHKALGDLSGNKDETKPADFVPYTILDETTGKPMAFTVNPVSVVKIKNAKLAESKAGETSTLTFDILNDGVDTEEGLTYSVLDKDGKDIVKDVKVNRMIGGYREDVSLKVPVAADAKDVKVKVIVKDAAGKELASQDVTETLIDKLTVENLTISKTGVRNEYAVNAIVKNTGETKLAASKVEIGYVKDGNDNAVASLDCPALDLDETKSFTQIIKLDPNTSFATVKADDGSVTETGEIYVKTASDYSKQVTERTLDGNQMAYVDAVKDVTLANAVNGVVTLKEKEEKLLTPKVTSSLASATKGTDGSEGLQFVMKSKNPDVLEVSRDGDAKPVKKGTAKVEILTYPKNYEFNAALDNTNTKISGTYDDAYMDIPECAIIKKEVTVNVTDGSVNPKPTPSSTPKPSKLKVGDKFTSGSVKYKVSSSKAITVIGAKSKKASSVKIPATVKKNGVKYNVTAIGAKAFKGYKKLKSVVIGSKVKTIGKQAFYNCTKLAKITVKSKVLKKVGSKAFYKIKKNAKFTLSGSKKVKKKIKKLLKKKSVGYKKTMKIK